MLGKVTTGTISCAGATDRAYTDFQAYSKYRIEVNEKIAFDGDIDVNLEPLNNALDHGDIKLEFMFEGLVDIANRIQFSNVSNEHKRIKIIPYNFVDPSPENPTGIIPLPIFTEIAQDNKTVVYEGATPAETEEGIPIIRYETVSFCLSPQQ